MMKFMSVFAAAGLGAAVMATPSFAEEAADGPDPRLGKETNRICFQRSISGWKSVKGEDDVVLLERGLNHWYWVELAGGCRESMLRSALSIGIDSRPAGGCVSRGDVIIVRDTPSFTRRCVITRIYEWDEDAVAEEADAEDDGAEAADAEY